MYVQYSICIISRPDEAEFLEIRLADLIEQISQLYNVGICTTSTSTVKSKHLIVMYVHLIDHNSTSSIQYILGILV